MPHTLAGKKLSLGFSPCPNDTFIFNALVHGQAGVEGPEFAPIEIADVETLNQWAMAGKLDVTKLSFNALGRVLDKYVLLMAGSALGRGCGPLLVGRKPCPVSALPGLTVAIPGELTTAAMLLRLYSPPTLKTRVMRFDAIMPAIAAGEVDAGVIIHESRFTYQAHGLVLLADLGSWWEGLTGLPIPLGGIAAKRSLGSELIRAIDCALRASVAVAFAAPEEAMPYIRRHAQELDRQVVMEHIALYVNNFSLDLGEEGLAAVSEFMALGREAGVFPATGAGLPLTSQAL